MTQTIKAVRRVLQWRAWLTGLYLAAVPQAIGKVIDFFGTNGIEATGISAAKGAGMNLTQLGLTFCFSLVLHASVYVRSHPLPEVVEQPITPPPFPPNP
jgi:hypothetical protein